MVVLIFRIGVDGAKLKKFIDTMKIEGFTCFESEIGVPGISFEIN